AARQSGRQGAVGSSEMKAAAAGAAAAASQPAPKPAAAAKKKDSGRSARLEEARQKAKERLEHLSKPEVKKYSVELSVPDKKGALKKLLKMLSSQPYPTEGIDVELAFENKQPLVICANDLTAEQARSLLAALDKLKCYARVKK
ncbi:MAG: hypothetical protein AB7S36_21490, partial [Planctomycetota bacterium]